MMLLEIDIEVNVPIKKLLSILKNTNGEAALLYILAKQLLKKAGINTGGIPSKCKCDFSSIFQPLVDISSLKEAMEHDKKSEYLVSMYLSHRFDLLGSGWVSADTDAESLGVFGHCYAVTPIEVNRKKVSYNYKSIDWQRDLKSGYRFDVKMRSTECAAARLPIGVDIKIPWELSRVQHLSQLALAGLSKPDINATLCKEFVNEVYDFCENNPVGFGVNWACTMDVAIRVVNLLISYDIFYQIGNSITKDFSEYFCRNIILHGQFIARNLEKDFLCDKSGNHYLSDLLGLLFIGSYLDCKVANHWYDFAAREFLREIPKQFFTDGGNYEFSTAYQRLNAEIVALSTAVILGKRVKLDEKIEHRLSAILRFLKSNVKPNGRLIQIGDNDSGHALKLCPKGEINSIDALKEGYCLPAAQYYADKSIFIEEALNADATIDLMSALFDAQNKKSPENALIRAYAKETLLSTCPIIEKEVKENLIDLSNNLSYKKKTVVQVSIRGEIKVECFGEFGFVIFRAENFTLYVRTPVQLKKGNTSHAHNDFLHYEYLVDGVEYHSDQGSGLYTPMADIRELFRSVSAHNVPNHGEEQQESIDCWTIKIKTSGFITYLGSHGIEMYLESGSLRHIRRIDISETGFEVSDMCNREFTIFNEFSCSSNGYGIISGY